MVLPVTATRMTVARMRVGTRGSLRDALMLLHREETSSDPARRRMAMEIYFALCDIGVHVFPYHVARADEPWS